MTWFGWVLIALNVIRGVATVARIGKVDKPVTPGVAAGLVVIQGLFIVGILAVGTGHL